MKEIFVNPRYPESLIRLQELAYTLWCTWNYDAIKLFYRIDSKLFRDVGHNPVRFLYNLPQERIAELSGDKGFLHSLVEVWEHYQDYLKYEVDRNDNFGGESEEHFGSRSEMSVEGSALDE